MFYSQKPEQFKESNGYVISGVWYPRVTSIVNIKAKPALYRFYAELSGFKEGEEIKRKSADEGTMVHEAVQAILTNNDPKIDPIIAPAIRAFQDFLEEKNIQVDPETVEKRVVNYNERYAGTVDSLALIDGRFGVLDIKTSQSIYRDYNLQTAAYFPALQEEFRNLQTRWILRIDQVEHCLKCNALRRTKGGREKIRSPLKSNGVSYSTCNHEWSNVEGKIELKEFPYWQDDFYAFLGAKKLWEWEYNSVLRDIGYL